MQTENECESWFLGVLRLSSVCVPVLTRRNLENLFVFPPKIAVVIKKLSIEKFSVTKSTLFSALIKKYVSYQKILLLKEGKIFFIEFRT